MPPKEKVGDAFYFFLEDKEEIRAAEKKEKKISTLINIIFLVIGAVFSLIVVLVYEKFFKKDRKLFGTIVNREGRKLLRSFAALNAGIRT